MSAAREHRSTEGMAHSVKQRLLNHSRDTGDSFNLVLVRFGIERLLYRIVRAGYSDEFVVKGATLFLLWMPRPHRPTLDLDLLGFGEPSAGRLTALFRKVCDAVVEPDGLRLDASTVTVEPIREESIYDGLRVRLVAHLGKARIPLQVDVGFGDAVTPAPVDATFGSILDLPAPRLRAYPPETMIAEKLDAMITLGMANSRMKDYFDIWTLSRIFRFSLSGLRAAIAATLARRGADWPAALPVGLTEAFAEDAAKQAQWAGFLRRISGSEAMPTLVTVVTSVREFLGPVLRGESMAADAWAPGGPWM